MHYGIDKNKNFKLQTLVGVRTCMQITFFKSKFISLLVKISSYSVILHKQMRTCLYCVLTYGTKLKTSKM